MVKDYFSLNGLTFKGTSEYYMKKVDTFDFSAYAVSRMADFDLNCTILWIGIERSSKSTGTLHHIRRLYRYWDGRDKRKLGTLNATDKKLLADGWIDTNMIYKREQGFDPMKYQKRAGIVFDDAILVSDRRESMSPQQVAFLKYLNRYAYNDNVIHALIQNLSDIDQRVSSKAKLTYLVYERGSALMYASNQLFPIMKTSLFDWFFENPFLLNNKIGGLHALKSIAGFIDDVHYPALVGNSLYDRYLEKKKSIEDENTIIWMEQMRYGGKCNVCQKDVNVGESGYYDKESKLIYCVQHGKELYDLRAKVWVPEKKVGRPKKKNINVEYEE